MAVKANMHLKTLGSPEHNRNAWKVIFHDGFLAEYRELPSAVQDKLVASALLIQEKGPLLGRPLVDTLKGSRHANMKELRFDAQGGAWRVAFAFDPQRKAVLLVAGDKAGVAKDRFYADLLRIADPRFAEHLKSIPHDGGK